MFFPKLVCLSIFAALLAAPDDANAQCQLFKRFKGQQTNCAPCPPAQSGCVQCPPVRPLSCRPLRQRVQVCPSPAPCAAPSATLGSSCGGSSCGACYGGGMMGGTIIDGGDYGGSMGGTFIYGGMGGTIIDGGMGAPVMGGAPMSFPPVSYSADKTNVNLRTTTGGVLTLEVPKSSVSYPIE